MQYLQYAIVPISVAILMPLIIGLLQKKIRKKEQNYTIDYFIICVPLFVGILLLIMTIVFTVILFLLNIYDRASVYVNIIMIPFLLCFYIGCYAIVREKIIIKCDTIKITPFIGKKKTCSLRDIKIVKKSTFTNLTVYKVFFDTEKAMFSVSSNNIGFNLFIELINKYNIVVECLK